jgi:hypothetical protein
MSTEPIDFVANTLSGEDLYLRHDYLIAAVELRDLSEEERAEFAILDEMDSQMGLLVHRGETFIAEHHFTEYARQIVLHRQY